MIVGTGLNTRPFLYLAIWCNGSTSDFDSEGIGSKPIVAAKRGLWCVFFLSSTLSPLAS